MLCHGCDAGPGRISWSLKLPLSRVKPRSHWSGACLSCATSRHCVTSVTNHPSLDAAPTATPHFVMLNFYFHCTTAYDILRHCGVELGKRDFIGAI